MEGILEKAATGAFQNNAKNTKDGKSKRGRGGKTERTKGQKKVRGGEADIKLGPGAAPEVEIKLEPGAGQQHRDYHEYTANQHIQVASIAQSRVVIENRERNTLNDRIFSMHTKKVAGKRVLIEDLKFMITNTSQDDPDHALYLKELQILHGDLAYALNDLASSEQSIIDVAMEFEAKGASKISLL